MQKVTSCALQLNPSPYKIYIVSMILKKDNIISAGVGVAITIAGSMAMWVIEIKERVALLESDMVYMREDVEDLEAR